MSDRAEERLGFLDRVGSWIQDIVSGLGPLVCILTGAMIISEGRSTLDTIAGIGVAMIGLHIARKQSRDEGEIAAMKALLALFARPGEIKVTTTVGARAAALSEELKRMEGEDGR
jgi:hypothetical protein